MVWISVGCETILDTTPKGLLTDEQLNTAEAVDGVVTAAYASLKAHFQGLDPTFFQPPSNWSYGDVRSDDAYKGGGGPGDIIEYNQMETFNITPDIFVFERKWRASYIAIGNVNSAIRALQNISEAAYPNKEIRLAEMRVLRGHFYFDLKKNFYSFPFIDETHTFGDIGTVSNDLTSEQLWSLIEEDFAYGLDILPMVQSEVNRVNKFVAHAYLAKAYIFQGKWQQASDQASEVINSGIYSLVDDYEKLYSLPEWNNSPEDIFSIAFSVRDGSEAGVINWGDLLTSPMGPAYGGGDGFHRPTQNLVNAFKTDERGLPMFTTFNQSNLTHDDFVDPRLDHAIGRPGIPWKDFEGSVYIENWARSSNVYGPYSKKKNIISPNSPYRATAGFPWALGALDFPLIKYTDVLLWKAEALIELGNTTDAMMYVNQIRERAANAPYVTQLGSNELAANYRIGLYEIADFVDPTFATQAVRFERRLELCLEGHRFYDLVRWSVADQVLNTFFVEERNIRPHLNAAQFTPNRNEYLPVPQSEIDRSQGVYTQNRFYR